MEYVHPEFQKIMSGFVHNYTSNYSKSDYCRECNGDGISPDDGEQCFECERLISLEATADRMFEESREY